VDVGVDGGRRDHRILAEVADLDIARQFSQQAIGRPERRDAAPGHDDDGVGLMYHRLVEAMAERIAGEGENGAADGDRSR
jgi:hypothetical protein